MKISAIAAAAAPLSVLLLAACSSPAPAPSSSGGSAASASSPAAAPGSYTFSTAPADENATEIALSASTDAYFNQRYGTQLPAAAEQCEPASAAGSPDVLWQCGYVIRGNNETTIKITGPHSWQIVPPDGN